MAISQIPIASSGLSTSDLITQPQWTLLGSNTSTTYSTTQKITSIPQTYRRLKLEGFIVQQSNSDTTSFFVNDDFNPIYRQIIKSETTGGGVYSFALNYSYPATGLKLNDSATYFGTGVYYFGIEIDNYNTSEKKPFSMKTLFVPPSGTRYEETSYGYIDTTSAITSLGIGSHNQAYLNNIRFISLSGAGMFLYGAK